MDFGRRIDDVTQQLPRIVSQGEYYVGAEYPVSSVSSSRERVDFFMPMPASGWLTRSRQ